MNRFPMPITESHALESEHRMRIEPARSRQTVLAVRAAAASPQGHGGQRRSYQIDELLARRNFRVRSYVTEPHPLKLKDLPNALSFLLRHVFRLQLTIDGLGRCWRHIRHLETLFNDEATRPVLLWENTFNHVSLLMAKARKFRVIALPQNLEALAPNSILPATTPGMLNSFRRDIEYLRLCDGVVTISAEEQWLLGQFGIRSTFIPYVPPEDVEAELVAIRQDRLTSPKNAFLILGTSLNPPTFEGISELIGMLESLTIPDVSFEIAGFGTEGIRAPNSHGIICHGSVTQPKLRELMLRARGAIVYQARGCGALTRIPELLAAGVPVLANRIAARSALDYSGIHVADTLIELKQLLMIKQLPEPGRPQFDSMRRRHAGLFFDLCFPCPDQ